MDQTTAVWLVIGVAALAANWPYLSGRLLLIGPRVAHKHAGWRLLELALCAALALGLGVMLESRIGQRYEQGWEFYAAGLCLFITLGSPGFVWCYLRRSRGQD